MAGSVHSARVRPLAADNPAKAVALVSLYNAATIALSCGHDRWEFAIEIEHLLAAGANPTVLRELRCSGLVEAALETTNNASARRRFRKIRSLALPPHSCLTLTSAGERLVAADVQMLANISAEIRGIRFEQPSAPTASPAVPEVNRPRWDKRSRTLSVNGQIVKRLQRPANSQATILDAFEEECWPRSIYDPLPPRPGIVSKRRLHNAINKLNSGLRSTVIHFYGNGNGMAVCWEWRAISDMSS